MELASFIRHYRLLNLFIVAGAQGAFYFLLIQPFLQENKIDSTLHQVDTLLLILLTVLITSGGYLINDYYDQETDKANHKEKPQKYYSSLLPIYYSITAIGGAIATYMAWNLHFLSGIWIYPAILILLWLYSRYLQKISTVGNIVVALFCAASFLLFYWMEYTSIEALQNSNENQYSVLITVIVSFAIFAFMLNWVREIVKDMQDAHGDQYVNYNTLPIQIGQQKTIVVITFLQFLLFFLEVLFLVYLVTRGMYVEASFYSILILIHGGYLFFRTLKKLQAAQLNSINNQLKIHMALGIIYLCFFGIIQIYG